MMLRVRRYRAFLGIAIIVTFSLYHLTRIRRWEPHPTGVDQFHLVGQYHIATTSSSSFAKPLLTSSAIERLNSATQTSGPKESSLPPHFLTQTTAQPSTLVDFPELPSATENPRGSEPISGKSSSPSSQQASVTRPAEAGVANNETQRIVNEEDIADEFELHGQGRLEIDQESFSVPKPHWKAQKEHFPVPSGQLIQLPSGTPKPIPPIQHDFGSERPSIQKEREERLGAIRTAFQHAWGGYKKYAMPHDELSPVSRDFRDPFNGWGATLVDALDTLWIMDLKDDFEEAVTQVGRIDFTTSNRNDIPLFETVIRYLGGLLAAYDVSSGQYSILLEKAVELAEILMGAFDTPNRMPVTYYYWAPSYASQPHRASARVVLAELGSLSMEFTRLAQITKNSKYYDAVARITNALETWQKNTSLPGLWPVSVDASGCKKPNRFSAQMAHSASHGPQNFLPPIQNSPAQMTDKIESDSQQQDRTNSSSLQSHKMARRKLDDAGLLDDEEPALPSSDHAANTSATLPFHGESQRPSKSPMDGVGCLDQGLASPPYGGIDSFTMGAMSDSAYEYLPKTWLLLGGLNDQYQSMYKDAMDVVREKLLYRPMTESGRDVLFSGTLRVTAPSVGENQTKTSTSDLKYEMQHLTCFLGGVFALGAKAFSIEKDLEIAHKLADGCIWAYGSTTTGVMPESFQVVPCSGSAECGWNETGWWEALDPHRYAREEQAKAWTEYQKLLGEEEPVSEAKGSETPEPSSMTSLSPAETGNVAADEGLVKRDGLVDQALSSGNFSRQSASSSSKAPESENQLLSNPATTRTRPTEDLEDSGRQTSPQSSTGVFTHVGIATHEEFVQARIKEERLPPGFSQINSRKYLLRPEAVESVFIMYRATGDQYWQEQGWKMFAAIQAHTFTEYGNSAIADVTSELPPLLDEMESFWLAETLKYLYLLYSDPGLISLDDYVFNTEAHPFKRPV